MESIRSSSSVAGGGARLLLLANKLIVVALLMQVCLVVVCASEQQQKELSDLPAAAMEEASTQAHETKRPMGAAGEIEEADLNAVKVLLRKNLKRLRKVHGEVVDSIRQARKYETQYKIVYEIVDKIFSILEFQKVYLENVTDGQIDALSFLSKSHVNVDSFQATMDVLSNLALFSDIVDEVPDKMHRMMKKSESEWLPTARWACKFVERVRDLIEPEIFERIHLAMQEMRVVERGPDYRDPKSAKQKSKSEKPKKAKRKKEPVLTRIEL